MKKNEEAANWREKIKLHHVFKHLSLAYVGIVHPSHLTSIVQSHTHTHTHVQTHTHSHTEPHLHI